LIGILALGYGCIPAASGYETISSNTVKLGAFIWRHTQFAHHNYILMTTTWLPGWSTR